MIKKETKIIKLSHFANEIHVAWRLLFSLLLQFQGISFVFEHLGRVSLVEVSRQEVGAERDTIRNNSSSKDTSQIKDSSCQKLNHKQIISVCFRYLYPWTKVEKSMLSTEPDRQLGRRTEHLQRIF